MRVIRAGTAALLIECESQDQVFQLQDELPEQPGAVEVIPGDRTLMVISDQAITDDSPLAAAVRASAAAAQSPPGAGRRAAQPVVVEVRYDGEDLPAAAELVGMTVAALVQAHTGSLWTAQFLGFCPGFAYLTNPNAGLHVPRRDSPRAKIPAGSVALGAEYSAVYPTSSPGGWQLIGRTELALWDALRNPPALLTAGAQVQFVAVT